MADKAHLLGSAAIGATLLAIAAVLNCPQLVATSAAGLAINHFFNLTDLGVRFGANHLSQQSGELNHHLQEALQNAYLAAINKLEVDWETYADDENLKAITTEAAALFTEMRYDVDELLTVEQLDQMLGSAAALNAFQASTSEAQASLDRTIKEYLGDSTSSQLATYVQGHLVDQIKLCFIEELKIDDAKHNPAWRAFQMVMLNGLQDELQSLRSEQSKYTAVLTTELTEIKNRLAFIEPVQRDPWGGAALDVVWENLKETIKNEGRRTRRVVRTEADRVIAESNSLSKAARIKRVRDMNVGVGVEGSDLLIPKYADAVYQPRTVDHEAQSKLDKASVVVIRGKPGSGKTRIAWECLRRFPDAYVILPVSDQPPATFSTTGIEDHDVILLLDDLHQRAQTIDAAAWWQALKDHWRERCRLIATVRSGDYWGEVENKQAKFLRMIGPDCIVDANKFTKKIDGEALRKQLGLSAEEFETRWDGTPGGLVLDFNEMGNEYRRLRDERIGDVLMSQLMDAAKLLNDARQPILRETTLRAVCEHILGSGAMSLSTWRTLKRRTNEQAFGSIEDGILGTYRPYLERPDVSDYDPAEDRESLLTLLCNEGEAEALFYYGVAAQLDWETFDLAEAAYRAAIDGGNTDAHNNLGVLLTERARAIDVDADAALRAAIATGDTYTLNALGIFQVGPGHAGEAEVAYDAAIATGDTEEYVKLAHLLTEQMDASAAEAEAAYRAAIDAGNTKAHLNLGVLLAEQGRSDEAEAAFRAAIAAGITVAHLNLGVLLAEQGRSDEAERMTEE